MGNRKNNLICINCKEPLRDTWTYCPNCQWRVEATRCTKCNEQIDSRWKFCPRCTNQIGPVTTEQRLFNEGNEWLTEVLR